MPETRLQEKGVVGMTEELKPCPFCGRTDMELCVVDECGDRRGPEEVGHIDCKCGCSMQSDGVHERCVDAKNEVIAQWNRRADA